jgi:hypothetical protein
VESIEGNERWPVDLQCDGDQELSRVSRRVAELVRLLVQSGERSFALDGLGVHASEETLLRALSQLPQEKQERYIPEMEALLKQRRSWR